MATGSTLPVVKVGHVTPHTQLEKYGVLADLALGLLYYSIILTIVETINTIINTRKVTEMSPHGSRGSVRQFQTIRIVLLIIMEM